MLILYHVNFKKAYGTDKGGEQSPDFRTGGAIKRPPMDEMT